MADELPQNVDNLTDRAKKVDELGSDGFIVALAGAVAFPIALLVSSLVIRYLDTNWVLTYSVTSSLLPTVAMFGTSLVRRGGLRGMRLSRAIKLLRGEQQRVLWKLEQGKKHDVYTPEQLRQIRSKFQSITLKIDRLTEQLNGRLTNAEELLSEVGESDVDQLQLNAQDGEKLSDLLEQIQRELASREERPGEG